jgi:uncharacterized SAM-binding protein YcdF (DUF218 family)
MPDGRLRRALRLATRVAVIVVIAAVLGAAAFLPFAGRYLHVNDPLQHADAIFVLSGARVERWLEGFDLYTDRWAPRIVLSPGRYEPAEVRLRATGIRYPAESDLVRDALAQMKVPAHAILVLPHSVDNTAQEAAAIRVICEREGWKTLIVVTSVYHTKRVKLAFQREFSGTSVSIVVRSTRHDAATPDRWWTSRADIRAVAYELPKLVLYRLGLKG